MSIPPKYIVTIYLISIGRGELQLMEVSLYYFNIQNKEIIFKFQPHCNNSQKYFFENSSC